jgi:uncharacterized protein (TIGR02145 family)
MKEHLLLSFIIFFGGFRSFSQTPGGGVTDIDGKKYSTVIIGTQEWMSKNLNVERFRNGDSIFHAKSMEEWLTAGESGQPAWCYFNNDKVYESKFGKLYNWYAVNDPRGLAPQGFNVPSNYDWDILVDYLGGMENSGTKLKSAQGWLGGGNGSNSSGFSALPCGLRYTVGNFGEMGEFGFWWSSSSLAEIDILSAWVFGLSSENNLLQFENWKAGGMSVRCVKE